MANSTSAHDRASGYNRIDVHPLRDQLSEFFQNVDYGVEQYRAMEKNIDEWREAVIRGEQPFTEETEKRILSDLREWLEITANNLEAIKLIEEQLGYQAVQGGQDLQCCAWGAEQRLKNWTRPTLTATRGLRHEELTEDESSELLEAIEKKTARPPVQPQRINAW